MVESQSDLERPEYKSIPMVSDLEADPVVLVALE